MAKIGWKYSAVSDFTKTSAGGTPQKSNKAYYEGGDIPWLLSGEVGTPEITQAKNYITVEGLKNSSAKLFPPDSVLVAMYGATAGEVGILQFEASTNQAVCAIFPSDNHVPKFLYYYLLHAKADLVSQAVGNAQPNISQTKIKSLCIPLPPLEEQRRIVAILDEAFEGLARAKENAEVNLQNARELFESYIDKAFNTAAHECQQVTLDTISENLDRQRVPITKKDRQPGDIPYYGASGVVDFVSDHIFDEDLLLVSEDGANLLARTYPIAFSVSGKSWVNNHAHVLRFEDAETQEYLRLYLNSISLEPYVSGMAQPKLNQKALNRIPIPLPDAASRNSIVRRASNLTSSVELLEQKYVETARDLEDLRQSFLQKAFAGELT
ncbi:restriction endonuclease subunit S [Ruegeria marisrubri]|uniref:restriction endonuclease subunit S n=1 Tax=Ruegeria marisrubri TaxID=1685379 RepID=UPI001CD2EACA|nr:restriction endonuclease subunit S [Ruegeria marisrubri]MCA0906068.1 restriction endonuclease subunit S [Ruegeria marisrubri]